MPRTLKNKGEKMWQDTVMNEKQIITCLHGGNFTPETGKRIVEAQAEISFEAGYKQHKKELERTLTFIADVCLEHHGAGRREVVEWVDNNVNWRRDAPYKSTLDPDDWQPQKKDWGI